MFTLKSGKKEGEEGAFVSLDPNELAALFASAPPVKLRRGVLRAGEGLASCARLGDVVLLAGGGRLCVFDPANVALGGTNRTRRTGGGGDTNANANPQTANPQNSQNPQTTGSARSFVTSDGALARRFADQFAPFVAAVGPAATNASTRAATYIRVHFERRRKRRGEQRSRLSVSI